MSECVRFNRLTHQVLLTTPTCARRSKMFQLSWPKMLAGFNGKPEAVQSEACAALDTYVFRFAEGRQNKKE
jgi:hypothetical protein